MLLWVRKQLFEFFILNPPSGTVKPISWTRKLPIPTDTDSSSPFSQKHHPEASSVSSPKYTHTCMDLQRHLFSSHMRCVQKVSYLWSAKIQLFIWMSETLIPFKVVSLVKHTLLPAVLPLLETFLESFLWNHVQQGCRVPHNVFS